MNFVSHADLLSKNSAIFCKNRPKNSQKLKLSSGDCHISIKPLYSGYNSGRTNFVSHADLLSKNSAIFCKNRPKNSQKLKLSSGDCHISIKPLYSGYNSGRTNFVSHADLLLKNSAIFAKNSQNQPNFDFYPCGLSFSNKSSILRIFWW